MLYLFVFLGGVVIGIIVSKIGVQRSSAYGNFKIEPYDEDNMDSTKLIWKLHLIKIYSKKTSLS